jgi:hypothetical protein
MRTITFITNLSIAVAVTATLASCSTVARHVSEEATTELAQEVRDTVVERADGEPLASYSLLYGALHDVVDRDAAEVASENAHSTFIPAYHGLDDRDGDGLDDDGRVEITVRHASSCLIVDGRRLRIDDGDC